MPIWQRSSTSIAEDIRPCTCQAILRTNCIWVRTRSSGFARVGLREYVFIAPPVSANTGRCLHTEEAVAARQRRKRAGIDGPRELGERQHRWRMGILVDDAAFACGSGTNTLVIRNSRQIAEPCVGEEASADI